MAHPNVPISFVSTERNPTYGTAMYERPILNYSYSSGTIIGQNTGNWIPFLANNDGKLLVDIGAPAISFTGSVNVGSAVMISGGYIGITGYAFLETGLAKTNEYLANLQVATTNSYTFNTQEVTSSYVTIPTGAKTWSVSIESGRAYINNVSYPAGSSIGGGGYGYGVGLKVAIGVGCTGGRTIVNYEI